MKASLIAIVFTLQTGCAFQKPIPNTPYQDRLGKVAVVTTSDAPVIDVEGISQLKAAGFGSAGGAVAGAAVGGVTCGAPMLIVAILCPFCATAALTGIGTCVGVGATAGATAGAVDGTTSGATAEDAERMRADGAELIATFQARSIQQLLRDHTEANIVARDANSVLVLAENQVAPAGNDYSSFAAAGVDTVLEVAFTEVGYRGGRIAGLTMKAEARLVDTIKNEELFSSSYAWQGRRLKTGELANVGAEGILKEVQNGYQSMATHIDENIFLLFPFPDRKPVSSQVVFEPVFMHGLAPSSPLYTYSLITPVVDGLQPMLAWQVFPRASDIKRVSEQMSRVKDVRYDLVIADKKNNFPSEIIYQREGLTENSHKLEISLSPGEHYYWTVRARFELDGRQQLTEWSTTDVYNIYKIINAPNQGSYQFKTPKTIVEQE